MDTVWTGWGLLEVLGLMLVLGVVLVVLMRGR